MNIDTLKKHQDISLTHYEYIFNEYWYIEKASGYFSNSL